MNIKTIKSKLNHIFINIKNLFYPKRQIDLKDDTDDPRLEQLIQQRQYTIPIGIPYIRLSIFLSFILAAIVDSEMCFFWLCLAFLWSIVLAFHIKKRFVIGEHRQRIRQLYFEVELWEKFKKKYPFLSDRQVELVMLGYKDYLNMMLISDCHVFIPSKAVEAMRAIYSLDKYLYDPKMSYVIGKTLVHREVNYQNINDFYCQIYLKAKFMERCQAWRYGCYLMGENPLRAKSLPRLFLIDEVIGWENPRQFNVEHLKSDYKLYKKHYENYEEITYYFDKDVPHLGLDSDPSAEYRSEP